MFISKFAWILVKGSIFVGIILKIIVGFKKISGRIIGRFKSIIDLNFMTATIYTLTINMKTHCA